jgi:outer membrane protein
MKTTIRLGLAGLLAAATFAPAMAQGTFSDVQNYFNGPTGYQAGDIMVHLSAIGVLPQSWGGQTSIPGVNNVKVSDGVSPEVDGSYFLTSHLDLNLIAATSRHNVSVVGSGANVKVGSTWVLPPTLTLQYHLPQLDGIRPYAGIGLTVAFFYGNRPAVGEGITATDYSTGVGPSFNAGFDVPIRGNWVANVDVKQMLLVTSARVNHGAIKAQTLLDPTVVGVGVGYLF